MNARFMLLFGIGNEFTQERPAVKKQDRVKSSAQKMCSWKIHHLLYLQSVVLDNYTCIKFSVKPETWPKG